MKKEENTHESVVAKKVKRQRTFIIFAVIIAFVVVCLFTPLFGISSITVKNIQVLDEKTVIRASGIELGDNVFRLNTRVCEKAIGALGYVESVKVKRKFPARIVIEIEESKEVAYVSYLGNHLAIDIKGKIIDVLKGSDIKPDKPVITGLVVKKYKKGTTVSPTVPEKKDFALKILQSLENNNLLSEVKKINIPDVKNAKLTLNTDTTVNLGDESQLDYKFAYLVEILKKLENLRGGEIDLTDTKNVIYKGGK